MIQYQLKLRMAKTQEKIAESWLPILGSVDLCTTSRSGR
jgi:hypothetical protein